MIKNAFPVSVQAARAALTFIPSDDRDVWWRVGMALKSEFGEGGFDLFHDWSERGASFDTKAVKSTWLSFKPGGKVTIGTLIAEAKRGGFNPKDYAPAAPLSSADKERIHKIARSEIGFALLAACCGVDHCRCRGCMPGESNGSLLALFTPRALRAPIIRYFRNLSKGVVW